MSMEQKNETLIFSKLTKKLDCIKGDKNEFSEIIFKKTSKKLSAMAKTIFS